MAMSSAADPYTAPTASGQSPGRAPHSVVEAKTRANRPFFRLPHRQGGGDAAELMLGRRGGRRRSDPLNPEHVRDTTRPWPVESQERCASPA